MSLAESHARPEKPSSSAGAVALARAVESARRSDDRLFSDPLARRLLGRSASALLGIARLPVLGALMLGVGDLLSPGVRGFAVGRTRYIDDATSAALRDGLDQIVILGAGYDSRAYRIDGIDRTRVFEVDLRATQALKQVRLDRILGRAPAHVCFVPIDFNRESLGDVLSRAGFREGEGTFFIWEGVTEYLSAPVVDATLRYVAGAARPGSRIAFTYFDRGVLEGAKRFPRASAILASEGFGGERISFGLDPAGLRHYLSERGLELIEDVAGAELAARYFRPLGRRLRANEFQRTALARISRSPTDRADRLRPP